jgi:tRNA (cytosine49-C5)-methyltransferase
MTPSERRQRKLRQFLDRTAGALRVDAEEAKALLSLRRRASVRVNRLTEQPAGEIARSLRDDGYPIEPIDWCADAYRLLDRKRELAESRWFKGGYAYIQNASSLLPVLALDPRPGDAILDVCAAPGGKASHAASVIGGDGELWVNDPIKPRVEKLQEVLATFRVTPSNVSAHLGQYIDKFVPRTFDRVLLDAQCSGEGMLDLGHPNALRFWSLGRVLKYGQLQRKMLAAAFKLLRPGGTLVYSTCSFAPEENEQVVHHLLRYQRDAVVGDIDLRFPNRRSGLAEWEGSRFHPDLRKALRVQPTEFMEGFFVCKLRKLPDGHQ